MPEREKLGVETEEAILRALAYSEDGELKQLQLDQQISNVLNLIHVERGHSNLT